jgi:hypothetical protein
MKIHHSKPGFIHISLSGAEAMILLEELETLRGGARMPKIRQMCFELRTTLMLGASEDKLRGRPPKTDPLVDALKKALEGDTPCDD